jgi:hypothetical protein
MVAMSLPKNHIRQILPKVTALAPDISFASSDSFSWSPQQQTITYKEADLDKAEGIWSLLHETAHALLEHRIYKTDFELLMMEVAAWKHAKSLADSLGVTIDEDYLQDCLDTYRDWLHRRSTCPACGNVGLQHSSSEYRCHNCNGTWHVTAARFCRPYRKKQLTNKEKSPGFTKNQTTFR